MLYVDRQFQRSQILNSIKQWCLYLAAIFLTMVIVGALASPDGLTLATFWSNITFFAPGTIAGLLLLPILIYDMLKATNRVAGPIHRLRQEMHRLEVGEEVAEIKLRQKDHWSELTDDFNRLAKQIQNERQQQKQTDNAPNSRQNIYSFPESVN